MEKEDRKVPEYEAPEVEQVLSAEEIAREVHYAGAAQVSDIGSIG